MDEDKFRVLVWDRKKAIKILADKEWQQICVKLLNYDLNVNHSSHNFRLPK